MHTQPSAEQVLFLGPQQQGPSHIEKENMPIWEFSFVFGIYLVSQLTVRAHRFGPPEKDSQDEQYGVRPAGRSLSSSSTSASVTNYLIVLCQRSQDRSGQQESFSVHLPPT
jgi:hypothetical protein